MEESLMCWVHTVEHVSEVVLGLGRALVCSLLEQLKSSDIVLGTHTCKQYCVDLGRELIFYK